MRAMKADDQASLARDLLGGDLVLRLEHAREEAASRSTRQVELLAALSRASAEALPLSETADGVAREIMAAFEGASVIVHMVVDDHLEIIAPWGSESKDIETVPGWLRRVPLDGPTIISTAAREKCVVTRAVGNAQGQDRRGRGDRAARARRPALASR